MRTVRFFAIAIGSLLVSGAAHAQQAQPQITLTLGASPEATIHSSTYKCGDKASFQASYVNADPNFLAIVPVEGKSTVFVSAISGSGARYTSGRYEWWTKGNAAVLRDLTGEEGSPPLLECTAQPS